jgi:hypothetical protein
MEVVGPNWLLIATAVAAVIVIFVLGVLVAVFVMSRRTRQ